VKILLPRSVAEALGVEPGEKLQVVRGEGYVQLLPLRPASKLRGFLRGMRADFEREPDRI